jgi:hypothetical protein
MLKFLSWSNRDDIEKRKFDKWNEYLGRIKIAPKELGGIIG